MRKRPRAQQARHAVGITGLPGLVLALLVLSAFAACGTAPVVDTPDGYSGMPAGTRLTLHKRLVIPPRKWSVYFQHGAATSFGGVDEYQPYCELQLTGPGEAEQSIEPGEFEIVQVRDDVSLVPQAVVMVAASGHRMADVLERDFVLYDTIMHLRAASQPRVTLLRCARLDEARIGQFLSLNQIREALGSIITLTLPPSPAHGENRLRQQERDSSPRTPAQRSRPQTVTSVCCAAS